MNLEVLKVLEKSVNAIMAVEVANLKVVSDNRMAREMFTEKDVPIRLSTLFMSSGKAEEVMSEVLVDLESLDKVRVWDTEVMGGDGEKIACDMEFSYVNDSKTHLFLKVRPILDNKTFYLEKFIETRKRPAFTMSRTGDFIIGMGNASFYRAFACNEESLRIRYHGEFALFLQEAGREDDLAKMRNAISRNPSGILDIPIQTAYGDTLWFYYDTKKLRQLEKEDHSLMFCLLVSKTDTIENLDDPFDH